MRSWVRLPEGSPLSYESPRTAVATNVNSRVALRPEGSTPDGANATSLVSHMFCLIIPILAEEAESESVQYRFESYMRHHLYSHRLTDETTRLRTELCGFDSCWEYHAPVAQLVVQPPCKRQVIGSSPIGGSNLIH